MKTKSQSGPGTTGKLLLSFLFLMLLGTVQAARAQWSGSPDIYYNGGKVGIGTSSPGATLDVAGTVYTNNQTLLLWNVGRTISNSTGIEGQASGGLEIGTNGAGPLTLYTSTAERLRINSSGNVGIGTTSPTTTLHISSASPARGIAQIIGASGSTGAQIQLTQGGIDDWAFGQPAGVSAFAIWSGRAVGANGTERFRIDSSGNVGIGTASPLTKLHTKGSGFFESGSLNGINIIPGASVQTIQSDWNSGGGDTPILIKTQGGGNQFYLATNGKVGIGTTSPGAFLDVRGAGNAAAFFNYQASSTTTGLVYGTFNNGGGTAYLGLEDSGPNSIGSGVLAYAAVFGHGGAHPTQLITNNVARLTIDSTGKVGIGKNDPGAALDVVGDIQASGVIRAKYQDVAEWVPSSEQLAAGTVVVLDSTKSNQVTSSSVSYDTRVAGVISEQPGIALGEKSDSKVLVATTGRVLVKVDATKGPIHIGDLLVTSDIPGVAMKSEPVEFAGRKMHMPGTLIGKALEPLEKGKGEILVLLSLQ